jgi:hypothetical protein
MPGAREYQRRIAALHQRAGARRYWQERALWRKLETLDSQSAGLVPYVMARGNAAARARLELSQERWHRFAAYIERLRQEALQEALAA